MSLLLPPTTVRERWTYGVGKHEGETIDFVAENDPGYLRWTWKQPLSDDAIRAIEEVAEEYDIDLTRK